MLVWRSRSRMRLLAVAFALGGLLFAVSSLVFGMFSHQGDPRSSVHALQKQLFTLESSKRIALVFPFFSGDVDKLSASLSRWPSPGPVCLPPDNPHGLSREWVDVVFFFHKDLEAHERSSLIKEELLAGMSEWRHCVHDVRFLSANLTDAEDAYPAGPSNQFYRLMLDMPNFASEYSAMTWLEHDVMTVRAGVLERLVDEALMRGKFWIKGSLYQGPAFDEAVWWGGVSMKWAPHINGNALYAVGDSEFEAKIREARVCRQLRELGAWHPFDVCLWAVLHDLPRAWPGYQHYARWTQYSSFIANLGYSINIVALDAARADPETYFVHGSSASAGASIEGYSAEGSVNGQAMLNILAPSLRLADLKKLDRCAVVGPSLALFFGQYASQIDAADAVFRFDTGLDGIIVSPKTLRSSSYFMGLTAGTEVISQPQLMRYMIDNSGEFGGNDRDWNVLLTHFNTAHIRRQYAEFASVFKQAKLQLLDRTEMFDMAAEFADLLPGGMPLYATGMWRAVSIARRRCHKVDVYGVVAVDNTATSSSGFGGTVPWLPEVLTAGSLPGVTIVDQERLMPFLNTSTLYSYKPSAVTIDPRVPTPLANLTSPPTTFGKCVVLDPEAPLPATSLPTETYVLYERLVADDVVASKSSVVMIALSRGSVERADANLHDAIDDFRKAYKEAIIESTDKLNVTVEAKANITERAMVLFEETLESNDTERTVVPLFDITADDKEWISKLRHVKVRADLGAAISASVLARAHEMTRIPLHQHLFTSGIDAALHILAARELCVGGLKLAGYGPPPILTSVSIHQRTMTSISVVRLQMGSKGALSLLWSPFLYARVHSAISLIDPAYFDSSFEGGKCMDPPAITSKTCIVVMTTPETSDAALTKTLTSLNRHARCVDQVTVVGSAVPVAVVRAASPMASVHSNAKWANVDYATLHSDSFCKGASFVTHMTAGQESLSFLFPHVLASADDRPTRVVVAPSAANQNSIIERIDGPYALRGENPIQAHPAHPQTFHAKHYERARKHLAEAHPTEDLIELVPDGGQFGALQFMTSFVNSRFKDSYEWINHSSPYWPAPWIAV